MLLSEFKRLVEQGQRHFDPDAEISAMLVPEGRRSHAAARFVLANTAGQLDQLADILSHRKDLHSTKVMAYLIIAERCFADVAPTFDMHRKRIGGKAFRNIDQNNLEFFVDTSCEGCFSDKERERHYRIGLRERLARRVLGELGITVTLLDDQLFGLETVFERLFACIQYAHQGRIKTSLPALGKAYSTAELRETITMLHAYNKKIKLAVEHYKHKNPSDKNFRQKHIVRAILYGSQWLLAQYVVMATKVGDKSTARFTHDSMAFLLRQRRDSWAGDLLVTSALDHLKRAPAPVRKTIGYGAAAAGAGLMATASAVADTSTDEEAVSLLDSSTDTYDKRPLLEEADETSAEYKPCT